MAFEVKKGKASVGKVFLEVKLPGVEDVLKYSVKRMTQAQIVPVQVRGKREGKSTQEIAMEIFGVVMKGIESIDESMDFSDLAEIVAQNGDDAMGDFVEYVVGLASKSTAELQADGETIL